MSLVIDASCRSAIDMTCLAVPCHAAALVSVSCWIPERHGKRSVVRSHSRGKPLVRNRESSVPALAAIDASLQGLHCLVDFVEAANGN
jgi:hypothetical protein